MSRKLDSKRPLWLRLAWFAGLWIAGVVAVGAVAYGIRLALLGG